MMTAAMALGCLFPANKSPWCVRLKGLQTDLGLSGMSLLVAEPWWLPPMIDIQYDIAVAILYGFRRIW